MPDPGSTPAATLYLVDGYALIYRAFFAMIARPLTTRRGENTSAAWGITNFLLRLLEQRRPDYLTWVHDMGESFRHQTYAEYKATREKLTAELQQDFDRSVERIEQILAAFGVPAEGVVDYLALVGDTSDNIPGVRGVGDKTALELLKTFGDLDAILANADKIPGKRAREAVQQHADLARLSRDLVTIRRDVPLALDLEAFRVQAPDTARLTELFTELEFRSLIPRLSSLEVAVARAAAPAAERAPAVAAAPATATPAVLAAVSADPTIVDAPAGLAALVAECRRAKLVALDTETTSLDPMRAELVGMSLAVAPGRSWYLPFGHVAPDGELAGGTQPGNLPALASEPLRPLRELLADAAVLKAGHNVKYDWLVLR